MLHLHAIVLERDHVHLPAEELRELVLVNLPPLRLLQALVLHDHELRIIKPHRAKQSVRRRSIEDEVVIGQSTLLALAVHINIIS